MTEMTKNETIYRDKDGGRWFFIREGHGLFQGCNMYVRVKDGYRLYHPWENMTEESLWLKQKKLSEKRSLVNG